MSSTIRPRTPCKIIRKTGKYDVNGRQQFSTKTTKTKCAVVWLKDVAEDTSVRADSSASRGRAEEVVMPARLLFKPRDDVRLGDVIEVTQRGFDPVKIEVVSVHRRPDVDGRIHHLQVEGDRWASE